MATVTTLPATFVSGAVLTAAQMNDLRGAFRVLQVVTGVTSATTTNNTNAYIATGLTQTITPSSTSSQILVFVNHSDCSKTAANALNSLRLGLQRNGSDIRTLCRFGGFTNTAMELNFGQAGLFLDSPASVSALTYRTVFQSPENTAGVIVQANNGESQIVLMEISA